MCLLTYFPEGVQPDVESLIKGANYNDDGHGFAIVIPRYGKHGRILVRKSMKAAGLIREFSILRELYPDGPALFHSRIATDGDTGLFNCHPFMLSGDKRTVIGHNGMFPYSVRPAKGDIRSDTRIFASEVAERFQLHTQLGRSLAREWMGSYNKIVILSVDPAFDQYGYIVNEKEGIWENGIWYSNSSFRGYRTSGNTTWSYTGTGWTAEVGDWEWCPQPGCPAQAATVNPYSLICTRCRCCFVCGEHPCSCHLTETTKGKGASDANGASPGSTGATVLGPKSPKSDTTSADATLAEADAEMDALVDEYRVALDAAQQLGGGVQVGGFEYGDYGDPEDDSGPVSAEQFKQVLALVGVANAGGDVASVDVSDDRWGSDDVGDYLIHKGVKYRVS